MSPLSINILKILQANPLGLALTRLVALAGHPMHDCELSLKALKRHEFVQEIETGVWKIGPKSSAVHELGSRATLPQTPDRSVEAPARRAYDPHAPKPRRTCPSCLTEKSCIAFYAGDPICRKCRTDAASGRAAGPAVDVTPAAPKVRPDGAIEIPAGPVAFRLPDGELPARTKAPLPGHVAIVIDMLERRRDEIAQAIATIRSIYA